MLEGSIGTGSAIGLFVTYNVLAFLTQPLFGHLLDTSRHGLRFLSAGVGMLEVGGLLTLFLSFLSLPTPTLAYLPILLIGLGNAIFHVFGGKTVAVTTAGDMRHLGVFVSTGALGLLIGQALESRGFLLAFMAYMALLWRELHVCCASQHTWAPLPHQPVTAASPRMAGTGERTGSNWSSASRALILFMMLLVFVRSLAGQMASPGSSTTVVMAVMVFLTFAGKASGGFIARLWGTWRTLCLALLLACLCFVCSVWHVAFGLGLVLTVNLTMPLTLSLANRALPGREGLAFGLLAATLIPGYALGAYCVDSILAWQLAYPLVATIMIEALVLLLMGEKRWQVLAMSVLMNILTNVPLNLLALTFPLLQTSLPVQLAAELIVLILESTFFYLAVRNVRQALTYATLCNAISYLAGLLFTLLLG